jgi:hypothetical protein
MIDSRRDEWDVLIAQSINLGCSVYSGQIDPSFRLIDPPAGKGHPEGPFVNLMQ